MIASYRRNFIFIKTKKTASTTIEIALTASCGPDDVITPVATADERLRVIDGKVGARNYSADRAVIDAFDRLVLEGDGRFPRREDDEGQSRFYNHMPASEIRAALPDLWARAHKFTVERHPYEKVVSAAYFRQWRNPGRSIETMIDRAADMDDEGSRYSIDGVLAVDEILKVETLEEDMRRLAGRLDLQLAFPLPNAKGTRRTDRRPAREILTDEQKARVYDRQRQTFDRMGYEP